MRSAIRGRHAHVPELVVMHPSLDSFVPDLKRPKNKDQRAAKVLRDDPMPYLSSALLLGLFAACGIPDVGAYLGGIALTVKKHATRG